MLFNPLTYLKNIQMSGSSQKGEPDDPFAPRKQRAWHEVTKEEARCDFAPGRWSFGSRGIKFLALWRRSIYGQTLTEIKGNAANAHKFADGLVPFIRDVIGENLGSGDWAIVTPPPRRHKEGNFAQRSAALMAAMLHVNFYPDVAEVKNRQRVNAEFTLLNLPPERNLIIYDDICTTGSTLIAMERLLRQYGKNTVCIVGINNHK